MTEPTNEPTPGTEPVVTPTPEPKPADKKSFTQDELDKLFADRQKRGEDAAAKRLEKQYKAQLDELSNKLKAFEEKDLTDVEKLKKEHEKATGKLSELDKELTGVKLENAKLKALIKAGAGPDQLDGLLKRVSGSNEEEIFADVEELKAYGWVGQKKVDEPAKEPLRGLGTLTKTGDATPPKSLKDRVKEINTRLLDKAIPFREKEDLLKEVTKLNRRISQGET